MAHVTITADDISSLIDKGTKTANVPHSTFIDNQLHYLYISSGAAGGVDHCLRASEKWTSGQLYYILLVIFII